jgi:hypothetical protein
MSAAIVSVIAVVTVAGAVGLMILSARLRREVADLFRAFDRAERTHVPLVVTVRSDRDRLAERLERLTDPGAEPTHR